MRSPSPIAALSLDAGGALLHPAEPVGRTYARIAREHGGTRSEPEVVAGFAAAFAAPWPGPRYVGDGRPFWRHIVSTATGVSDARCFERLYRHYEDPGAWRIAPGAAPALRRWRSAGGRVALTSDWDLRLDPLLRALDLDALLDVQSISAEVGAEKPSAAIFEATVSRLGCPATAVLHLGDSERRDVHGARAAGLRSLRWTGDRPALPEIVHTLLAGRLPPGAA